MEHKWNNYHKHTEFSNLVVQDCVVKISDYIQRAKELGHDTYFTTEHGFGGDIFEAKTLCDQAGLHCKFAVEAYIVKNNKGKDDRNYHIVVIPTTNTARKKLNKIISEANLYGFYKRARISLSDILSLDEEDVYITTACIAGILRDIDGMNDIFLPLVKKFGNHVLLEVQPHNHAEQIRINKLALSLSKHYGLKIISACDSHYIRPEDAEDRILYLKSKDVYYKDSDENSFTLDYPDTETLLRRYTEQGVLTVEQAMEAIQNTNIFDECEDIEISLDIKMPNIYKNKSVEERIGILKNIVSKEFEKIIPTIPVKKLPEYIKEIQEEMKVVEDTAEVHSMDYFLLNYEIVHKAVNVYGGILTRSGRGSCSSFYLNYVLGMTQVDKVAEKIPLYPDRFMSTARLIENRSLPDIDYNVVSDEPFVQASKDFIGEKGVYPMIAYGTIKEDGAFKASCKALGVPYNAVEEVAKEKEKYKDKEPWRSAIALSEKLVNTIVSKSIHPCSYLLFDGDIESEIGVIRCSSETSKEIQYSALITSAEADAYKYLKNDYLKVEVWKIISEVFKEIGEPIYTINQLREKLDDKTWLMYSAGLTATLNQTDSSFGTSFVKRYRPKSVEEMAMFVACIRPSFNSWREDFIQRKPFSTGVPQMDKVLSSTNHYILFQENLMQYFIWLKLTPAEAINIIKKISKKKIKEDDFKKLEERLKKSWIEIIGSEKGFTENWQMIQSCISYGFCSAHGLCVAYDSLYGAYLKSHYPLQYYTVAFNTYKKDLDKTTALTAELKHFGIKINPISYGHSKGGYTYDLTTNTIYKGVESVKTLNEQVANELYELSQTIHTASFVTLLQAIKEKTSLKKNQIEALIQIGFLKEFGNIPTLLKIFEYTQILKYGTAKSINKDKAIEYGFESYQIQDYASCLNKDGSESKSYKFDNSADDFLHHVEQTLKEENIPDLDVVEKMKLQKEYLGYISSGTGKPEDRTKLFISDLKPLKKVGGKKPWGYKVFTISIGSGKEAEVTVLSRVYSRNPIEKGDVILTSREGISKRNGYWYLYLYEKRKDNSK